MLFDLLNGRGHGRAFFVFASLYERLIHVATRWCSPGAWQCGNFRIPEQQPIKRDNAGSLHSDTNSTKQMEA
jgi:hypothetical protein